MAPGPGRRRPARFRWRRQWYIVEEVLEAWAEVGTGWVVNPGAPLPESHIWRVKAEGGGVFELAEQLGADGQWRLLAIFD